MFKAGDYVVYGNNGVCFVEEIGTMNMPGISKEKLYYTLAPIYAKGSKMFTSVDNGKVIMRPVISKKEALELIGSVESLEVLWADDEKQREALFKEALGACECKSWVKVIKTLYIQKKARLAEGKKVRVNDEKYLRMAEESLFGELSVPLNMDKDEVKEVLTSHITF